MLFPHTEMDSMYDKLRSDIIKAAEEWVESYVKYCLQNTDVSNDSILDIVQSVKNNLNSHTAIFAANRIYGLESDIKILEKEISQILNGIHQSDEYIRRLIKP